MLNLILSKKEGHAQRAVGISYHVALGDGLFAGSYTSLATSKDNLGLSLSSEVV